MIDISKRLNLTKLVSFEVQVMSSLSHENIVKFEDCFLIERKTPMGIKLNLYILMELIDGMSISDLSASFEIPNKHLGTILLQILNGLYYLHSIKIIHRDLKGDNISFSLSNRCIKISNYLFSKI